MLENLPAIGEFIGSYGFPMVMCLIMFWYMNKEREDHKAEVTAMTEAINNNTVALEAIKDKLAVNG